MAQFALWLGHLFAAALLISAGCSDDVFSSSTTGAAEAAATEACHASCEHQGSYCETLNMDGCLDLCACVLSTITDSETCLELATEMWTCSVQGAWTCSDETDIVGAPEDIDSCAQANAAFRDAGWEKPCGTAPLPHTTP